MKKDIKGFTLVELLAVITVLGIVMAIGAISVTDLINRSKEKSYNEQINTIELAAKTFATKHTEILDEESTTNYILMEELKKDGLLENIDIIDPRNGKEIEGCINVIYNKDNNKYEYNFTDKCKYTEKLLNGADPKLSKELIPVIIKDNGEVYKADITEKWYSYEEKTWANAVILFDKDKYDVGERIYESAIKEYYVWIPKYSYRLWNVNSDNTNNVEKPIEIVFGSKAKTTGTNNGDMYLHPAFTNFNTQGIWVGKFELSYNESTFTNSSTFLTTNPNTASVIESSDIIIKPNVRSLTYKKASDFFILTIKAHQNFNSHIMTNMEWGAVAYLTYSVYGRCENDICTEVTMNNINTGYYGSASVFDGQWKSGTTITGCAADNISDSVISNSGNCINTYQTQKGVLASTTGNISGIYDLNGGSWEFVMGILVESNGTVFAGRNSKYNSNFKGLYGCPTCDNDTSGITENTTGLDIPNAKYYNEYINNYDLGTNIWYDYSTGLLGDATKEVANTKTDSTSGTKGLWFGDYAYFITPTNSFFARGGNWSSKLAAGIFSFSRSYGYENTDRSTRVVLAF